MVITISVLVIFPLQLARFYQSAKLAETLSQYDTIKTEAIILQSVPLENDSLLFTNTKSFKPLGKNKVIVEEYMAVFNGKKCDYRPENLRLVTVAENSIGYPKEKMIPRNVLYSKLIESGDL